MRFTVISTVQLLVLAVVMSILVALLVSINSWYMFYTQLPVVHIDKSNACVKVDNFENGHAFNCNDVDVLLRRYRKSAE
jgi:hypothetical protein